MSEISGFNNNNLLSGFNKDGLLNGIADAAGRVIEGIGKSAGNVLGGINSTSQNETKHYFPEVIGVYQELLKQAVPGGKAETALKQAISQTQFNWDNRGDRDYYMNDFALQWSINNYRQLMQFDQQQTQVNQMRGPLV